MWEAVSPPFVMMFWVIEFYVFLIFQVHQEHFLVNKCEVLPLFEMFYPLSSGFTNRAAAWSKDGPCPSS